MPVESSISAALRLHATAGLFAYVEQLDESILRPAQQAVMHDVLDFFIEDERGYIALPTGSGKTVVMSQIIKSVDVPTLIVVPTKQLRDQTIAELQAWDIPQVQPIQDKRMRSFMAGTSDVPLIEVATYKALTDIAKTPWGKHKINPDDYGLVVLDEAHHAMAYGSNASLERFRHAYQIGLTATPDYSEARKLVSHLPRVIHELSITESIQMGVITRYVNVILNTGADMSRVKHGALDYDQQALERAINTEQRNTDIADFYVQTLAGKKALFSTSTVAHAQALQQELLQRGVAAATIDGKTPTAERNRILEAFREGTITAITNSRLLGEGFDEPTVEAVINVSPTLSQVRQIQRTGRGLRRDDHNQNKELIIVDCVDAKHTIKPVLFCDEEIGGGTGIVQASPETQRILERMASYQNGSTTVLTNDAAIYDRLADMIVPKPSAYKTQPPRPRSSAHKDIKTRAVAKFIHSQVFGEDVDDGEDWAQYALCAQTDPEAFFPEKGGSTREAKRVCLGCDVRDKCLEYALENEERFGIWGGLSERERRKLKKRAV